MPGKGGNVVMKIVTRALVWKPKNDTPPFLDAHLWLVKLLEDMAAQGATEDRIAAVILNTVNMSEIIKERWMRVCMRGPKAMEVYEERDRILKRFDNPPFHFGCSPAVVKNCVIFVMKD